MNRGLIGTSLVIMAAIAVCLFVLSMMNFGRIQPVPGLFFLEKLRYCTAPDCATSEPVTLPFVTPFNFDPVPGGERHEMRVTLPSLQSSDRLMGLFVPKYSDRLSIYLNGQLVYADPPGRRPWNGPALASLPPDLMTNADNRLTLVLTGDPPSRLDLHPMFFGDYDRLRPAFAARHALGPGVTRFGFALMVMLAAGYLVVWIMRSYQTTYLWMALSCGSAAVFLGLLGFSPQIIDYKLWTLIEACAMAGYCVFMLKFIRSLLTLQPLRAERVFGALILCGVLAVVIGPVSWVNLTSTLVYLPSIASGVVVVAIMWTNRDKLPKVDFWVFFPALSLSLGFAFDGFVQKLLEDTPRSLNLLHLMPLVTSMVCLWLILSQMARSLNQQETMTATLSVTLAEKTRELEASYAAMAQVQQKQAVQAERDRIMLDLHDGVGGQLVNTLAYMEAEGMQDQRLREALEATLRDLALMLDSLENHDSLVTLLGMMRLRLERLLSKHGMQFEWRIIEEPDLPEQPSTGRLNIARIVQEAITNALKHSSAGTICVFADRHEVSVRDDGIGFDVDALTDHPGYGLAGMRRRATSAGVDLVIESGPGGTTVHMKIPETTGEPNCDPSPRAV